MYVYMYVCMYVCMYLICVHVYKYVGLFYLSTVLITGWQLNEEGDSYFKEGELSVKILLLLHSKLN